VRTTSIETALLLSSLFLTVASSDPIAAGSRYVLIALLAVAMGAQNATARRLAVPDLTTTVLTLTITGISADSRVVHGPASRVGRRGLAVAAMFVGALVGSILVLRRCPHERSHGDSNSPPRSTPVWDTDRAVFVSVSA
jgi:uncharacterized membrane protein YoaK (UPF0700 family)